MSKTLTDRGRTLLESPNFAHVATIRNDGTPQVVPVWADVDNGHVLLNTAEGRAWPQNLRRDPRVTITVTNSENPYEYVTIRGRAVESTHEGADAHIDKLAKKYMGLDEYPLHRPDEQRVIFRIAPESVSHHGAPEDEG